MCIYEHAYGRSGSFTPADAPSAGESLLHTLSLCPDAPSGTLSAGESLLHALSLGPDAWGSGKAMLDLTLRDLDPDQARAVLLILINCTSGIQCEYVGRDHPVRGIVGLA